MLSTSTFNIVLCLSGGPFLCPFTIESASGGRATNKERK